MIDDSGEINLLTQGNTDTVFPVNSTLSFSFLDLSDLIWLLMLFIQWSYIYIYKISSVCSWFIFHDPIVILWYLICLFVVYNYDLIFMLWDLICLCFILYAFIYIFQFYIIRFGLLINRFDYSCFICLLTLKSKNVFLV